jgi:hypothetical protein
LENTFNKDFIDSVNFLPVVVSGNTTAENGQTYVNVASATYTDPTPAEGKGYTVIVRNGTATVGGTAYAVAGTIVNRIFHSGGWANYPIGPESIGANIASASTVNLANATGNSLTITGVITITSFGSVAAGAIFNLTFAGSLLLTHNATSLILPTGSNISTAAGDVAQFLSLGSGNWKCIGYLKANGSALSVYAASSGTLPQVPIDRYTTVSDVQFIRNGNVASFSGSFVYDETQTEGFGAGVLTPAISAMNAAAIGVDGTVVPLVEIGGTGFGFAIGTSCPVQTYYYCFNALLT